MTTRIPAFFHPDQLDFRPRYEWAFGRKIEHPERTERADRILAALRRHPERFSMRQPDESPRVEVAKQHAPSMLRLYDTATKQLEPGETFCPNVFLRRPHVEPNPENIHHAGYFCFDSGTPLSANAHAAALWSAACALAAADALDGSTRLSYALSRPPGHHADYDSFGGYCYVNNSALAATRLRARGRIAVLDIDVHHGNGTQSIFWRDADVLTLSIHSDPTETFPYFTGFASEIGGGAGRERNINLPMPRGTDGQAYAEVLDKTALPAIRSFEPQALVVAAGVDAYERDPVGTFALTTDDFYDVGERIGQLGLPTCVVQEGGYYPPDIGDNVVAVLEGIRAGM